MKASTNISATKKSQHQRAIDIIRKSPLHQQLNASQEWLIAITPQWQVWLRQCVASGLLTPDCAESTRLEACQQTYNGKKVEFNELVLSCSNAANATQIKQIRPSLLDFLNQKVTNRPFNLSRIIVQLRHQGQQHEISPKPIKRVHQQPSENAIRAIEASQNAISNQQLQGSLAKLAKTLRAIL